MNWDKAVKPEHPVELWKPNGKKVIRSSKSDINYYVEMFGWSMTPVEPPEKVLEDKKRREIAKARKQKMKELKFLKEEKELSAMEKEINDTKLELQEDQEAKKPGPKPKKVE
jgi:hypothetical protein